MLIFAGGDHHFKRSSPRWEEARRIHYWMVDQARERHPKPDLFLSAGDLYDGTSTPEDREAVADWLSAMADICPVVAVKGNHDRARDCLLMSRLEARNPIIVEEAAAVHYVAGAAVACLAWPKKAEVMARFGENGKQAAEQTAHQLLQNVIRGLGDEMAAHQGPKILLAHGMVRASKVSTGQELVGCDFEIGLEDLALARADIVILGHIHMAQDWTFNGAPIIYTGSQWRQNFGELEEKSYVVAYLPDEGGKPCENWHREPTPTPPMLHYNAEWGVFDGKAGWIGEDFDARMEQPGAEIRFRYTVDADRRDEARAAAEQIKENILSAGAISCKLDEQLRPTTRARAPEIAAATTVEDKLIAYWESKGITVDPKRRERLLAKVRQLETEVEQTEQAA